MARQRPATNWDEVPVVFDVPYAARLLGFTADTISRKCAKGELPAHKILDKWRFDKEELRKFIQNT